MHRSRVKVTLNPEASEAVRRLSLASGESMSGVISSLFDPCVSELNEMTDLLEKAAKMRQNLPGSSREFFRRMLAVVRDKSEPDNETPESCPDDKQRAQIVADVESKVAESRAKEQATAMNSDDNRIIGEPHGLEPWEIEELESEGPGFRSDYYE